MAQGRRAGSAVRRYSGSGHGFGALPPITSGLVFFGDLTNPNTSVISGAVATYADSSGNGRNFTQGTALNRPTYTASDATFGGRPSMTFDGVNDYLVRTALVWPGTQMTAFCVVRPSATPVATRIFSARAGVISSVPIIFQTAFSVFSTLYANPAGTYTQRDTAYVIAAGTTVRLAVALDISNGATAVQQQYVNGAATGSVSLSGASSGAAFGSADYGIGASDIGTAPFAGSMTDCLVYSSSLSAAQVALVDAWLKWRNGL